MNEKPPRGILIFSLLNLIVFGGFTFVGSLFLLVVPEQREKIMSLLAETDDLLGTLSPEQLRLMLTAQAVIGLLYLISGAGLLAGRECGRRATIYFSFALLLMVFFSALTQPRIAPQAVVNAIYPAALVMYFTHKSVEQWFKDKALSHKS